ncbi:MAG: bifunctional diguanylate cyclase/phosphodiesterase, partial [Chloroflexota bacterium]|nr:bifunctional diguanylate cyclase/phosphodiesterase [Chloroflexota bacterium]
GDEFAILLEGMLRAEDALTVVERITAAMRRPVTLETREVLVGASIGVAYVRPGQGVDELLRNADLAMYRAKAGGKGRHEVFEPAMHAALLARLELEADLRQAVERHEFRLVYQPIVELTSGQVTGVEALVRWEHPRHGLISPAKFIPLAEEMGLIIPLGRWVLKEACRQLRQWQLGALGESTPTVSVNLSGRQLQNSALLDDVGAVLAETQILPDRLILEITESVIMQDTEATLQKLHALKALGVRLAIDDFGTGYSSLSYLQRFPIDVLKIDKAFVDRVARGGSDAALARTIIALADMLKLRTVAEGVERAEQRTQLLALGCELGQGYLFAKPLTAADMDTLLAMQGDRLREAVAPASGTLRTDGT